MAFDLKRYYSLETQAQGLARQVADLTRQASTPDLKERLANFTRKFESQWNALDDQAKLAEKQIKDTKILLAEAENRLKSIERALSTVDANLNSLNRF
jgi:chromosome segregation ATPase